MSDLTIEEIELALIESIREMNRKSRIKVRARIIRKNVMKILKRADGRRRAARRWDSINPNYPDFYCGSLDQNKIQWWFSFEHMDNWYPCTRDVARRLMKAFSDGC